MAKPISCISLVLAGFIGCATTPAFEPKRDYAAYPGYEAENALYNIRGILGNSFCTRKNVDQAGLYCEWEDCTLRSKGVSTNPATGQVQYQDICMQSETKRMALKWSEINSVAYEGNCVRLNDDSNCSVRTRTPEQAEALQEAIKIYQREAAQQESRSE